MMGNRYSSLLKMAVLCAVLLVISGCLGRSKPAYVVEEFTLDYALPADKERAPLNTSIRIERFSATRAYSSKAMVYKSTPFRVAAYDYHRWRINPGDMVTDFLLRDLRASGAFQAVFSSYYAGKSRYAIEGGVEEFAGSYEIKPARASLAIAVTLMDLTEQEITKKIKFQKTYRIAEPLTGESPEDLARAMSKAVARFSKELITDVTGAISAAP